MANPFGAAQGRTGFVSDVDSARIAARENPHSGCETTTHNGTNRAGNREHSLSTGGRRNSSCGGSPWNMRKNLFAGVPVVEQALADSARFLIRDQALVA